MVPIPLGFDDQEREILSYIEGEVIDYLQSITISMLKSAANLLHRDHDLSQSFLINYEFDEKC
ncbi:MAG: hypothetical protein ACRYE9_04515 [Janthinobacterium lividum]